jgi:iron(III) transport system substrate-binding protein
MVFAISACGGAGGGSASGSNAQIGKTFDEVCEAGKAEGSVLYRTGGDAAIIDEQVKPFEDKYGIDVQYTSMKPQDTMQAVLAESQSRRTLSVDMTGAGPAAAMPALKAKLVANIDWSALGVPEDVQLKVQDVTLYRTGLVLGGLSYDSKRFKPEQLPNTWEELIDPKWAGEVIVDPRGKYLSPLALEWGKDKTVDWYTRLLDVDKAVPLEGESASLTKVTAGEQMLSTSGHNAQVDETNAHSGTSLAIKYLDVIPAEAQFPIVFAGAPHPNAVRCFAAWYNTDEGKKALYDTEFTQAQIPKDVPPDAVLAFSKTEEDARLDADTAAALAEKTTS